MEAIYNYLFVQYAPKYLYQKKAYQSEELHSIYKDIVKMGSKSPLYLVRLSDLKQQYAIGIKEDAMKLSDILEHIVGKDSQEEEDVYKGIQGFVEQYNVMIEDCHEYNQIQSGKSHSRLAYDLERYYTMNCSELQSCGIVSDEEGKLHIDENLFHEANQLDELKQIFSNENEFVQNVMNKLKAIILNPMEYVEKTVVAYPDTSRNGVAFSYITSIYSGMLFNYYC